MISLFTVARGTFALLLPATPFLYTMRSIATRVIIKPALSARGVRYSHSDSHGPEDTTAYPKESRLICGPCRLEVDRNYQALARRLGPESSPSQLSS